MVLRIFCTTCKIKVFALLKLRLCAKVVCGKLISIYLLAHRGFAA